MGVLDSFKLDGKVALVSGASHGIGEGIAIALAEAGADVAVAARSVADLDRVATIIRGTGRRAIVIPTDVNDLAGISAMVRSVEEQLGRLDILANVAGVARRKSIFDVSIDDWNYVMDVNLRGAFFVAREAALAIKKQPGGKIINIASMTAYRGFNDVSLYGMSKAAIIEMTRMMALEWAEFNIQVNGIAPGWIDTPMTASMSSERRAWVEEHVPQGKYGVPADIAKLAVYLASPASDYTTGQTIPVDGGFIAGNPWPKLA